MWFLYISCGAYPSAAHRKKAIHPESLAYPGPEGLATPSGVMRSEVIRTAEGKRTVMREDEVFVGYSVGVSE